MCMEDGRHQWQGSLRKSQSGSHLQEKASAEQSAEKADEHRTVQSRPVYWCAYSGKRMLAPGFQPQVCIQLVTAEGHVDPQPVSCMQYCHSLGL